jgi:hypothetical protein
MSDGEAGRMTDSTRRSGPLEGCLRGSPRLSSFLYDIAVVVSGVQNEGMFLESLNALMRPATEKRRGTKSRSEVHRWRGGLYGEFTAAPELEAVLNGPTSLGSSQVRAITLRTEVACRSKIAWTAAPFVLRCTCSPRHRRLRRR